MSIVNYARSEPVRAYVYSVVAAVLAALVVLGYVKADLVPVLLAVATAVLAVPAVEAARSKVSPTDPQ